MCETDRTLAACMQRKTSGGCAWAGEGCGACSPSEELVGSILPEATFLPEATQRFILTAVKLEEWRYILPQFTRDVASASIDLLLNSTDLDSRHYTLLHFLASIHACPHAWLRVAQAVGLSPFILFPPSFPRALYKK